MMSRGHVLCVILLPLLALVAADEPEEPMIAEMLEHNGPAGSGLLLALSRPPQLPGAVIPPSLMLQLLRSGALLRLAPQADNDNDSHRDDSASASGGGSRSDDDAEEEEEEEVKEEGGEEGAEVGAVRKRVFCNNFTGCGGKHRERSRRQNLERLGKRLLPLLLVKRPFCNSFGCYNGKRATAAAPQALPLAPAEPQAPSLSARLLGAALAASRANAGLNGPLSSSSGKRQFCNGFGGCKGGKRTLFAPWYTKMTAIAGGRR